MKVLIIVPDGVGVKNYLYSRFLKLLSESSDVQIWSKLPPEFLKANIPFDTSKIEFHLINLPSQPIVSRFFWEAASWARLIYFSKKFKNKSLLLNKSRAKYFSSLWFFLSLSRLFGYGISLDYGLILFAESFSRKLWKKDVVNEFINILKERNVNSILITHQRIVNLVPLCLAAKKLNIEINSVIFSWDNVPKAKLCIPADRFFVWSDFMKQELIKFYPEINSDHILVTGTPQFEFYKESNRVISRTKFAKKYVLDPDKKWICFSGDDLFTSPFDPLYLEDVCKSLLTFSEADRPQIILRKSPVDVGSRYDYLKKEYNDLIVFINPILVSKDQTNWDGVLTSYEDIDLLVNLSSHCEFVINIGSTMAFDFAVNNKPCIYINYNVKKSNFWNINTIYKFHHFRSMDGLSPVYFLDNNEEWSRLIPELLKFPENFCKDKQKWFQKIVLHPLENSSTILVKYLIPNKA